MANIRKYKDNEESRKAAILQRTEHSRNNYDRQVVLFKKGELDEIKEFAKTKGLSVSSYIASLVYADMKGEIKPIERKIHVRNIIDEEEQKKAEMVKIEPKTEPVREMMNKPTQEPLPDYPLGVSTMSDYTEEEYFKLPKEEQWRVAGYTPEQIEELKEEEAANLRKIDDIMERYLTDPDSITEKHEKETVRLQLEFYEVLKMVGRENEFKYDLSRLNRRYTTV